MLTIRMQRTGRKGHAMFRMVVQDSRRTPTSGKVVALLGSYDPHAKSVAVDKDKASFYLSNGARPSDRAAHLLKAEGVKLPKWVELEGKKAGAIKHPDKLRRNRPAGAEAPKAEEPKDEAVAEPDTAVEPTAEAELAAETVAEEPSAEVTDASEADSDESPEATTEEPAVETTEQPEAEADAEASESPDSAEPKTPENDS